MSRSAPAPVPSPVLDPAPTLAPGRAPGPIPSRVPSLVRALVLALALAAALAPTGAAVAKEVPYLSGRIVDEAGLLPPETTDRLESQLRRLEEETGAQVAVLTVESLEGEVLEDYSFRVAETWGLGRAGEDDGALLLVARDDRKLRIEVGYGLEGRLTDAQSGRIIRNLIVPRFKAGDYAGGIEAGVDAIAGAVRGEEGAIPEEEAEPFFDEAPRGFMERGLMALVFLVVVGMFSAIALFGKGCQGWFLYLFLTPFWLAFPAAILGPFGALLGIGWLIGFPILRLFFDRNPTGRRMKRSSPFLSGLATWAATSSSRSGGFRGGGGFSGGGGSFGGGGASGSW